MAIGSTTSSIFGLNINITALSNKSYIMTTCTYFIKNNDYY